MALTERDRRVGRNTSAKDALRELDRFDDLHDEVEADKQDDLEEATHA